MKKILLTGSHLTPALALISELKKHSWQITYIGGGVLESQLLPQSVNRFSISAPKLNRHNYSVFLVDIFRLPLSVISALRILKKTQPRVIVSFGGYLGLPVSLASFILRIPLIIHEQTFQSGLTSKLTGYLATRIAISWPSSQAYFPKYKTTLIGNPLRLDFIKLNSVNFKKYPPTLFITGGSQGSRIINQVVSKSLPNLLKRYQVIHQFGLSQSESDWQNQQQFKSSLPHTLSRRYQLSRWLSTKATATALHQASLIIGRSGINTVTEIGYLNKPAILIPLPFAQKREQLINAQYLVKLGLATIIHQSNLTPNNLTKAIKERLMQPLNSSKFPRDLVKDASKNLYQLIESVCEKKN